MNRLALTILLLLSVFTGIIAQEQERPVLSEQDREKWLCEMRNAKHDYLTRMLGLSKEQQEQFFPVYDEMDNQLAQIAFETREMERKADSNPQASDEELQAANQALYTQKSREGEIEAKYYPQFQQILTPRQLIRLKKAERDFTAKLIKHHAGKNTDGPKRKK